MDRRRLLQLGAAGFAASLAPRGFADPAAPITAPAVADAWLASLALIEMAAARARMLDPKSVGQHAGLNAFQHTRKLVAAGDRAITTPNNDTLYSNAFIDLTNGPVTLTVPDAGKRYLSVAIMDMYTNNNGIIGARTSGGAAGRWTLVGPAATQTGPRVIKVATPHAWVLARTLVDDDADMAAAHKVQDGLKLSGAKAGPYPKYATRADAWPDYFRSVDALLKTDPAPTPAGLAAFAALKAKAPSFDRAAFGAEADIIDKGVEQGRAILNIGGARARFDGGWQYPAASLGDFGDDFRYRAVVAIAGIGALVPAEAMYMRAEGEDGRIFKSDKAWKLSLPAAMPVNAFWSLTMYEATADGQFFFTENRINRYAIGDRTRGIKRRGDGGIDIWISRTDPGGEKAANWLPAPKAGPYSMILRAYLPKPDLLQGRFRLPPVVAA